MGLRQLLTEIAHWLAARVRHAQATTPGVTPAMSRPAAMVTTHYVSWLEDARKLRPARPAPATTVMLSRAALLRPMRFVADATRAAYRESGPIMGDSMTPARPAQPVSHASRPEPEPVMADSSTPDIDFLGASSEVLASLSPEQRMLLRIRYLVRRGIYNEGFTREVPEQYRHSLGIDETPSA